MIWALITAELTTLFGIICMFLLIEWRFPLRKILFWGAMACLVFVPFTAWFLMLHLPDHFVRAVYMPLMLALSYYLSQYRDLRTLFCNITSALFTIYGSLLNQLATTFFSPPVGAIVCIGIYIGCLLGVFFFFRNPLREMMRAISQGWGRLCLVPFSLAAALMLLMLEYHTLSIHPIHTLGIFTFSLAALVVYHVFYTLFLQLQRQSQMQQENSFLQIQVAAMEQQVNMIQAEQQQRILQHDLRHYARTISACVEQGSYTEAIKHLNQLSGVIDQLQAKNDTPHYCSSLTLNAALSHYIALAESEQVEVSVCLDIPEALPVDKLELAVVFANCIENAVNACKSLPPQERKLTLNSYSAGRGQFLEIANTCAAGIHFDPQSGLPLSNREGHGVGSHSIAGFVQKYDALLSYDVQDGWFKLRMMF